MRNILMMLAAVAALSACSENPQGMSGASNDTAAYTGTGKGYALSGWKQGDKADWEAKLKTRNQYGQNDYVRID
jgi:hypothetical protein